MIPTINKPTRVTRKTARAIDYILTNSFTDTTVKTSSIKSDVSDHFPVCLFIPPKEVSVENEIVHKCKRIINKESIEALNQSIMKTV